MKALRDREKVAAGDEERAEDMECDDAGVAGRSRDPEEALVHTVPVEQDPHDVVPCASSVTTENEGALEQVER